ncbi:S-layer protein [Gloeocapsopsis crepidinum LEGE 06123]|uniref:S-layer protein n=1 Tax=Gloeocapsopsis crepidinum LEGE 06123 TaxID=588587 RepID=A0ABR9UVH4_9CHRO|nr:S-layer protein [Gloeocapsopsis crepidinum]MBE9192274.1 S-layer protein [Gloeocapsopsis crepidinum LEGE 06123]
MNLRILATTVFLSTASLITPVKAQTPATESPTTPTTNPVANACIQNQAETLPVPFSDVSPDHWAFKAVMTMYYCGAFRQAAPPSLFQQSTPTQSQQSNPTESTIEFTAPVAPNS